MQNLTINTKKLLRSLKIASQFCNTNNTMPIMDCLLFKVNDNKAHIMSGDMESYIASSVDADSSSGNFGFCVNGKDFNRLVSLIRDDIINMEINEEDRKLSIVHSKGIANMPVYDASEYPLYKKSGDAKKIVISSSELTRLLKMAKDCVGSDALRPSMTGVFMSVNGGKMETCATNGTILYSDAFTVECDEQDPFQMIIGSKAFSGITEVAKSCDSVSVLNYDNLAVFKCGDDFAVIRKISANYPNYKSVIPDGEGYDKVYTFKKKDIIDAIKRCQVTTSSNQAMLAKIILENGTMKMRSDDIDFAKSTTEEIDATGTGDITFGVNMSFMTTCLGIVEGESVTIKIKHPQRAILLSDETEHPDRTIILMPAQLYS